MAELSLNDLKRNAHLLSKQNLEKGMQGMWAWPESIKGYFAGLSKRKHIKKLESDSSNL